MVYIISLTSCLIFADRDECQEGTAGCHHKCVNIMSGTSNSYKCECRDGFSLGEDLHSCTGESRAEYIISLLIMMQGIYGHTP